MNEPLQIVSVYFSKPEAELARGLLENEGITCVLKGEDAGGAWPNLCVGMGNYSLWVQVRDLMRAKEILMPAGSLDGGQPAVRRKSFAFGVVAVVLVVIALIGGITGRNWLRQSPVFNLRVADRVVQGAPSDKCRTIKKRPSLTEACYEYYADGKVYSEANYRDQKNHGPFIIYYPDGTAKSVMKYLDGKLEGRSYEYFPGGQVHWEWNYKDDRLNGTTVEYYDTGETKATYPYVDGLLEGTAKTYYPGGRLADESFYAKDRLLNAEGSVFSGPKKVLHENGRTWSEGSYRDGRMEGPYAEYDEQGRLMYQAFYRAGQLQGTAREYYPDGTWKSEAVYASNLIKSLREFDPQGRVILDKDYSKVVEP